MKNKFKRLINNVLKPLNLKIVSAHNGILTGQDLEHDLALINKQSPVCIDVGSNIGQTISLFNKSLKEPIIYSFEPSTEVYSKLENIYGDHKNVFLHHKGVGKQPDKLEFNNLSNTQLSSFLEPDSFPWSEAEKHKQITTESIEIITVDNFLSEKNINDVCILKSDTQGFDLNVLIGAQNAMTKGIIKYVLIEVNYHNLYKEQAAPNDIFKLLTECGYYPIDFYEKARHPSDNGSISWCTALFGRKENTELIDALPKF